MSHLTLLLCVHLHRFLVLNTLTALLLQNLLQILHSNIVLLLLPNPLPLPPFFFPTNAFNPLPVTNPRDPNTDFLTLLCTKWFVSKKQSQPNREILGILSNLELVKKGNSKARNHWVTSHFILQKTKSNNQSINPQSTHLKVLKEMGKILSFLGESLQVQCVTIPNGTKLPHFDDFFANVWWLFANVLLCCYRNNRIKMTWF